nr:organic cation/carnitine transporter 2-like [Aegilops tauschii subsp. strangulata]
MADTAAAPLLTSHKARPSIDETMEAYMGATGAGQLLKAVLLAFAWALDAQQVFISVFTDAEPPWHCTDADADASSCSAAAASPCALPPGAWAWDRPAVTSVVSEWSLECAGPALVSLPASSFFAGCLAGGFLLTTLADSLLGRRKMLLASIVSMSAAGVVTAFSPNVWAYAALRFVSGFGRSMVGTCTLVLSTELVGRRWRDTVCVAGFFCFTLGFLSLPALAYTFREASWRNMYLWTSVPSLCYSILFYFVVQESPRWLLVRGRRQDAIDTLQQMQIGGITSSNFSMIHACAMNDDDDDAEAGASSVFATLHSMWERPWALRRLAAIMTASFGVGMVYYGMPLNVGNLGSNLYLSVTYNALAELPSSILSWLLMGRINRRSSVVALTAAAGLWSLACVIIPQGTARMAAELVSFFATCTAFNVILMYSIELFPTSVRNSAVGLVRQALVLGGVAAPLLVALGRRNSFFSFGVLGLVIGCSGMFAACLPETKGKAMSDTMDEEDHKEHTCTVHDHVDTSTDLHIVQFP